MKRLNFFLVAFAILLTTILFSCKKNGTSPDDHSSNSMNTDISLGDLLGNYIVFTQSNNTVIALYFINQNGINDAYFDYLGTRRVIPFNPIKNNTLALTADGVVFTFNLKKDASGNLSLVSYSRPGGDNIQIDYAQIQKLTDAPVFIKNDGTDAIFNYTKTSDGDNALLYFKNVSSGQYWHYDDKHGPTIYMPMYAIGGAQAIGWKSNDDKAFGVVVPSWKGNNKATMLVQSSIAELDPGIHAALVF